MLHSTRDCNAFLPSSIKKGLCLNIVHNASLCCVGGSEGEGGGGGGWCWGGGGGRERLKREKNGRKNK